jgi:hypothetical protein
MRISVLSGNRPSPAGISSTGVVQGWPVRAPVVVSITPVDSHGHNLNDPAALQAAINDWCNGLAGAKGAEDGGNRDDPVHDWVIHPLVDGCTPSVIVE